MLLLCLIIRIDVAASDSPARERCINNNNIQTPNGNHYNQRPAIYIENSSQVVTPKRQKGHNGLNPMQMPLYDDNNVLKKVSNLEQLHHGGGYSTTPVGKTTRIYVPEKLHFSAYDRFEGKYSSKPILYNPEIFRYILYYYYLCLL